MLQRAVFVCDGHCGSDGHAAAPVGRASLPPCVPQHHGGGSRLCGLPRHAVEVHAGFGRGSDAVLCAGLLLHWALPAPVAVWAAATQPWHCAVLARCRDHVPRDCVQRGVAVCAVPPQLRVCAGYLLLTQSWLLRSRTARTPCASTQTGATTQRGSLSSGSARTSLRFCAGLRTCSTASC